MSEKKKSEDLIDALRYLGSAGAAFHDTSLDQFKREFLAMPKAPTKEEINRVLRERNMEGKWPGWPKPKPSIEVGVNWINVNISDTFRSQDGRVWVMTDKGPIEIGYQSSVEPIIDEWKDIEQEQSIDFKNELEKI